MRCTVHNKNYSGLQCEACVMAKYHVAKQAQQVGFVKEVFSGNRHLRKVFINGIAHIERFNDETYRMFCGHAGHENREKYRVTVDDYIDDRAACTHCLKELERLRNIESIGV